jgi:hypothetical protein
MATLQRRAPATVAAFLLTAGVLFALPARAALTPTDSLADLPQVADGTLEEVRGGFELGGGLSVSFGIDLTAHVDGQLVGTFQMTSQDGRHFTFNNAPTTVLGPAGSTSATYSLLTNGGELVTIQNSQNAVTLATQKTINLTLSGVDTTARSLNAANWFRNSTFRFH